MKNCVHVFAAIWVRSPSSRTRNSWSSWSWALIPMEPWSWSWKTCGRGWRSPTSCSSRCSRRVAMWNISLKWIDVTDRLNFFFPFCFFYFYSPKLSFLLARQCSSQSDPTSANQQIQLLLEEKQQLEAHNHQASSKGTLWRDCARLRGALKRF